MAEQFTEQEKAILAIVQKSISTSATPYADIAAEVGVPEEQVLQLLQRLTESGAIRRFGASIKHHKTGYTHNAMVAWRVSEDIIDAIGRQCAQYRLISHCYHRPTSYPDWQYNFFTMIHGREEKDWQDVIKQLRQETELDEYVVLTSEKELKKTSMVYFP